MRKTKGLIEQHIHGAFGYDFMTCKKDEIHKVAHLLLKNGVYAFFPTIMTADFSVIKERISVIKNAMQSQQREEAKIMGVHLEGPFISPNKLGIHELKYIQPLDISLYKEIEDEVIKIVTLAPELDINGNFINYLKNKKIKISAGHCEAVDLSNVNQVTHLYNAMTSFHHRDGATVVSALSNDEIYAEIIADSMHVSDDVLKITFRQKPLDKILLISDALPLAHSDKAEHIFAGQTIYNRNGKLLNENNTFAGSSMLLCDMVKNLVSKNILNFKEATDSASLNISNYHNIENNLSVYWDDLCNITGVELE